MNIAYLDCFSGVSGDMFLAALADSGVPLDVMQSAVADLHLGAHLELRRVNRSGIDSAKVDVVTSKGELAEVAQPPTPTATADSAHSHGVSHEHSSDHRHGRSLSEIQRIIRASSLAQEVQAIALKAFELLGHAEAKIHNLPVEAIHFHEVGAVDAIADIVGVSAGCRWLATERKVRRWSCSPLNVGGGHVHCAHGTFPVPAPATLELLRGLHVYSSGPRKEMVTPTGAALLRALEVTSSDFPAMRMIATGYGAGSRDLVGHPNVLRLVIGESTTQESLTLMPRESESTLSILETAIDDATPEVLAYVAERLLAAGASDVYRTPLMMKKGRSGIQLTVLCTPENANILKRIVFEETTTLGIRYREEKRQALQRTFVIVTTEWGDIRIKVGTLHSGEVMNAAPEFEDCKAVAQMHGIPLKLVMQAAMVAHSAHRNKA